MKGWYYGVNDKFCAESICVANSSDAYRILGGMWIFDPGCGTDGMYCKIGKARAVNMGVSSFQFGCSSALGAILRVLKFIKDEHFSRPFDRGRVFAIDVRIVKHELEGTLVFDPLECLH